MLHKLQSQCTLNQNTNVFLYATLDNIEINIKTQTAKIAKAILSNKNIAGNITIPDLQSTLQSKWQRQHGSGTRRDRHTDQQNITEDSEANPHSDEQLRWRDCPKHMLQQRQSIKNQCCRQNWVSTFRSMKSDPNLAQKWTQNGWKALI